MGGYYPRLDGGWPGTAPFGALVSGSSLLLCRGSLSRACAAFYVFQRSVQFFDGFAFC